MNYPVALNGEWIRPRRRGFYLRCCDCGLTHRLEFRLVAGTIYFRPFRLRRRPRKARST